MPTHAILPPTVRCSLIVHMTIFALLLMLLLASAVQSAGAQQSQDHAEQQQEEQDQQQVPGSIEWDKAPHGERNTVLQMLVSEDWPFRVFGLLRLERFTGGPALELLGDRLRDEAWQVRCFAIRQAKRMKITITPSDLANEKDPRVLRTALRQGIDLPPETLGPVATRLLRGRSLDHLMIGIEIAAASSDEPTREQAIKVTRRLISNMNGPIAAYVSKRLSRVLGFTRPIETVQQWRNYLNQVRGKIEFSVVDTADNPFAGTTLGGKLPIFAEMDNDSFAQLIDYMGSLAQYELDLVIVMDITASMQPMLDEARAGIDSLVQFMSDITRELRMGFIAYRDHDNPPVWQGHPFTTDVPSIRDFLFKLDTQGGADLPEAVYDGLAATAEMRWNGAAAKQVILIGDAPPHERDHERLGTLLHHFVDGEVTLHAIHIPQKRDPVFARMATPQQLEADKRFLTQYNSNTAKVYTDMVRVGDGEFAFLNEAEELVPAVMHFTIDKNWWHVFDAFYELYLEMCR